ncbi:hypothetical protein ACFV7O_14540 [Streptomyces tendae]|uniref:hypothetical protein n=1 Tax=Streptomyces tendae TaxID=1932 RepID=UPI0036669211
MPRPPYELVRAPAVAVGGNAAGIGPSAVGGGPRALAVAVPPTAGVRGTHGRLPDDPRDPPVLLCSDPAAERERWHVTEVKDLILRLSGLVPASTPRSDSA